MARARGLKLTVLSTSCFVRSDRRLLRRVLQNLLSNALKYTEKGRVVLGCRRRKGSISVEVHDTGPGIPSTHRQVIFKEFQRLEPQSHAVPGLGLGLSIVERMCRILSHPLELQSKLGQGSAFAVALPLVKWSGADAAPRLAVRQAVYGDMRGHIVLCIDNENAILNGMSTLLSGWGCFVLTASDARAAIAQIRAAKRVPHIVLTDFHLENANGIDAVAALNTELKTSLAAIVITADRSMAVREKVLAANYPLLHKPLKPASLRALMAQMLLRRPAAE
jgi:CheY-like chemotaxis protein/anti-sigma regulatory factor (Ser/Thr protein kinase)